MSFPIRYLPVSQLFESDMYKKTRTVGLHYEIEQQLKSFPSLYKLKPSNFPRHDKYEISYEKMTDYYNIKDGFWVINLPLMLHNTMPNRISK